MPAILFLLNILLIFGDGYCRKIRDPCDVVYEGMRFAGFMVRDCTYYDPYVYWRVEHHMTWEAARSACQQYKPTRRIYPALDVVLKNSNPNYLPMLVAGGELASVHNFDEKRLINALSENNDFVNEKSAKLNPFDQGVWIGLRKSLKNDNEWRWSDGTFFGYHDWLSDQPANSTGEDNCVHVTPYVAGSSFAIGWDDLSCKYGLKSVCKTVRLLLLSMGKK